VTMKRALENLANFTRNILGGASLLLLTTLPLSAIQPISIYKIGERDIGFYGNIDMAFSTVRGNSETETYALSTSLQKFNRTNIWFLNGSHTFSQSFGETIVNKSFVHLRNIREYLEATNSSGEIDWEIFTQIEHNQFQKLDFRGLVGTGPRIKPFNEYHIFLGISPMFVRETYLDDTEDENSIRGNIYLNFKRDLTETTDVSYIAYYQPKLTSPDDYDLIQNFQFKNRITKQLSILFQFSHRYNSHPVDGVKKSDVEQRTSFRYEF
jgi:putative salt-induced outer membrane protein YdiY